MDRISELESVLEKLMWLHKFSGGFPGMQMQSVNWKTAEIVKQLREILKEERTLVKD